MRVVFAALVACASEPQDDSESQNGGAGGIGGQAGATAGAAGTIAGSTTGTAGAAGSITAGTSSLPTAGSAGTTALPTAGSAAGQLSDASTDADVAADTGADASDSDASTPNTDDRCDVAQLDPSDPPSVLELSGNLGTHDPALLEADGVFYLFQTGPRVPGKTSTDLMSWDGAPSALGNQNPGWVASEVPGANDLWAPDLSQFGGKVHLYYSASTFGSNSSCIGHATRDSLASGAFEDQGSVICSNHGSNDDWNAIDPNVIVDQAGTPWLFFGSFWSGIKAVKLVQDGTRADDEVHAVASRGGGAIEAPFVVRRCGYYYLFVSFDRCCNGSDSTYNMRVGRSTEVLGPYLDKDGTEMLDGGGTLVVEGSDRYRGPGHNAVLFTGTRAYNVYHAYDSTMGGASRLRVAELAFDADGWPVSGGP